MKLESKNRFEIGSMENLLPMEIIFDIFSRLPFELVFECRRVCKTWRNIIYNPSFAHFYLQTGRQLPQFDDYDHNFNNKCNSIFNADSDEVGLGLLFLIRFSDKDKGNVGLYFGEYDENQIGKYSYEKLTKINHPPINKPNEFAMVGSCNGLICFSVPQYPIYDPVYIFNPITREYINLPRFNIKKRTDYWTGHMVCGFGYHPTTNYEYKVVRIYYCGKRPIGEVQVYTLGDGRGWRKKGKIPWSLSTMIHTKTYPPPSPGILANGALYWMNKEQKIVAFDLADEEFRVVSPPPCFLPTGYNEYKHCFQLRELGRCLCVVHQVRGECVEIWSFKKTKNGTSYKMKEEEYLSWTWSREFRIRWEGQHKNEYEPFALTKSGEVLLLYNHKILFRYDPKTATLKKLVVDDGTGLKYFQGVPHMNSFVSLKALGERCKTRRRYMCKDK
ncbi:F-box domain [Macleaya cordata]|uniref:F-box domain n=1 Tax=Macleaya cordata TaxID=56857 RepID=A0A200R9G9_MACCD|nr:F-box domain [Macleaya cordata]